MPDRQTYRLNPGDSPLLISVPHAGTLMPAGLERRLRPGALALPDTDWFVDRLYRPALDDGNGMLVARCSRYLIDLNRPSDDAPLYASVTTGLVPILGFGGQPLYEEGEEPGDEEVAERIDRWWRPYHRALVSELGKRVERHGHAVLLDAHSIAGEVPRLFDGRLPDLSLGSNEGASADSDLISRAADVLQASPYASVLDGRFKGGYITRFYGRPERGIHALQLEISQRSYMLESPPVWQPGRAARLQRTLRRFTALLRNWTPGDS